MNAMDSASTNAGMWCTGDYTRLRYARQDLESAASGSALRIPYLPTPRTLQRSHRTVGAVVVYGCGQTGCSKGAHSEARERERLFAAQKKETCLMH